MGVASDGESVGGSLSGLVGRVLKESGLEAYYKTLVEKSGADADEARLDNLQELVSSAAEFESTYDVEGDPAFSAGAGASNAQTEFAGVPALNPLAKEGVEWTPPLLAMLRAYLESVSLVADADKVDPASGAVTLMTLHAAKGLEFPAVAMIGLEEGVLPGSRALESEDQLEEERRLMFVGITRAMQRLHITSAKYRTHRGLRERTIPSRFLAELPREHVLVSDQSDAFGGLEEDEPGWGRDTGSFLSKRGDGGAGLPVGCSVRHPQFGVGVVRSVTPGVGARVEVEFKGVGRKTLVLEYARLTKM
jgi:DNA helicase-2/ATP-dependent DNA helicase PcrA